MATTTSEQPILSSPLLRKVLRRPRLHARLSALEDRRLILIYGKVGQGKTTLVAEYLDAAASAPDVKGPDIRAHWCTLEEEHRDPARFLGRVGAALSPLSTSGPDRETEPSSRELIAGLGALEGDGQIHWLILDDFESVNSSPAVCAIVDEIAAAVPENVRLVVLSPEYPRFSLADVISRKELALLGEEETAFTEEEIRSFFRSLYDLDLPDAVIAELHESTTGWVTALVHLGEQLEGKPQPAVDRLVRRFLTTKRLPSLDQFFDRRVVGALDERMRAALIRLSAFHVVSPELLSQLVEHSGEALVEDLEARSLFISLSDPEGKWFVLHPLFRRYLQGAFASLPEPERRSVHRAGAKYYYATGEHGEAAHHLLLGRGYGEAQKLLLERADTFLQRGQYRRLHDLLESFPEEIRNREPLLLYYYTITTNLVDPLPSRKTLARLLEVFRSLGDVLREAKIHSVLLVNYLFYQGNREAVIEIFAATRSFLDTFGGELDEETRLTVEALLSFARWWIQPEIDEAFDIALRAEEIAHGIHNEEVLLFSHLTLGRIYLDRGDFGRSTEALQQAEKLIVRNVALGQYEPLLRFYLGDAYFYLGDLAMAVEQVEQGLNRTHPEFAFRQYLKLNLVLYLLYIPEMDRAQSVLESIGEKSVGENLYLRYYSIYLLNMLLAYRKSDQQRAVFYCRRLMDPENRDLLATDYPYSHIALAEVQLFLKWYSEAERTLTDLLAGAPTDKHPYPAVSAHALFAIVLHEQGKAKESRRHFDAAAQIMTRRGYRNLDICSPSLLLRIASTSGLREFHELVRVRHLRANQLIGHDVPGLNIFTFGGFRILIDGRELPADVLTRHKKVMDLLKLLVTHRRDGLLKTFAHELFWPGYLEKSARNNLNTIVYRLRRILGEQTGYVITDPDRVRLDMSLCTVDADEFCSLVEAGDRERRKDNLSAALSAYLRAKQIYRGDFLEKDLYWDDVRDEREALRNRYLRLLMKLIKMHLDSGKNRQALEVNQELLVLDRLCEPAYRLLMICSSLVGNRSEIPRIFNRLHERLTRTFGIAPDPKTVTLKNSLLNGATPTARHWREETLI